MAYTCFKCKKQISGGIKSLFMHLRAVHCLNSASTHFQCSESGCGRTFSYMWSFKRHLEKEHEDENALNNPFEGPAPSDVEKAAEMEPAQQNEAVEENWDELEPEGITNRVALFLAHLRSKSSMTYSNLNFVVQHTSSLISDIVSRLQSKTMSLFRQFGLDQNQEVEELGVEFSEAAEPFKGMETDYKQMLYFAKSGNFIQPVEEIFSGVSYVQPTASGTGIVRQVGIPDSYYRISLKSLLSKILEIPGILQAMLEWQCREGDAIQDVFDGEYGKTHPLFQNEVSIPLIIYQDDCEIVNPLGSKTGIHKLGLIYFILKSLPPDLLSSLQSQFLLAVYKSDDVASYGFDAILHPIVEEIRCLERDGILVNIPNYQGVVKFTLLQVVGDNLGVHGVLGYIESFSANYVCRFCKADKGVVWSLTLEDPALLRDRSSYEADLLTADSSQTGLKRDSVLNNLSFYHVSDNVAVDIMHDVLEGVGPYEVKLVLSSLIEQKHLTLEKLNYRITSFDYGFCDKSNKPSVISKSDLRNLEGSMRQSASQMWCLLRLLPTMIGDLIPQGNKHWELLLLLLLCMEFIFSPSLTVSATLYLSKIIEEHHSLFLELYPHLHLRPKHHFMLHYPGVIQKLGPLRQFWAMRFEARHSFFKQVSHVTCNFRNICKTMAYRHQMMQCYNFLCGTVLCHSTDIGPGHSTFLANIEGFQEIQSGLEGIPLFSELYMPAWVTFKGTEYRAGMTVFLSYDPYGDPQFGLIKSVLLLEQTSHTPTMKLIIKKWETQWFDRHLFAYSVIPTQVLVAVDVSELLDHHPLHAAKSYRKDDESLYISLRYRLF